MSLQLAVSVRNARADSVQTSIGAAPTLRLRTGAPPADCGTADSGTVVVAIVLPSTWLTAASAGAVAKSGTWSGAATAAGTVGHFRIYDSGGTCRKQGTVTLTGGGGDMTANAVAVLLTQTITITSYGWTEPNA